MVSVQTAQDRERLRQYLESRASLIMLAGAKKVSVARMRALILREITRKG
jgi:hypothetical protein